MDGSDDRVSDALKMMVQEAEYLVEDRYKRSGASIFEAALLSHIQKQELCARISLMTAAPQDAGGIVAAVHAHFTVSFPSAEKCEELLAELNVRHQNVDRPCLQTYVEAAHRLHQAAKVRLVGEAYQVEGNPFVAAMEEGFHLFGTETAGALRNLASAGGRRGTMGELP